jgi:hypothetical protein
MDFNDTQKKTIADLVSRGFPENLAETAVAAQSAGYAKAVEHVAGVVKAMGKEVNPNAGDLKARREALQKELNELVASRDNSPNVMQRRFALKRALAKMA